MNAAQMQEAKKAAEILQSVYPEGIKPAEYLEAMMTLRIGTTILSHMKLEGGAMPPADAQLVAIEPRTQTDAEKRAALMRIAKSSTPKLSPAQQRIYDAIEHGPKNTKDLIAIAKSRGYLYAIKAELLKRGLIAERREGKHLVLARAVQTPS